MFLYYNRHSVFLGNEIANKSSLQVILSAGALNSPHILFHSGIGPRRMLEDFGIHVVADLPVGQNMRNHLGITMEFILSKMENKRDLDWNVLTEYLLKRDGPMSSTGITQVFQYIINLCNPSLVITLVRI